MREDAFGRPGYGHENVDDHARSIENDLLRQIEDAAAENPDNETDMDKRDVESNKAFGRPDLNRAAPDAGVVSDAEDDEDNEELSHVATDEHGRSTFVGTDDVETAEDRRSFEER